MKSSAIVGGASIVTIGMALLKGKLIAVLLGPAGVGLMGMYQNVVATASTFAGCGLSTSGVQQLAASAHDPTRFSAVRLSLRLANVALGLIGMGVFWSARYLISSWVFGDVTHAEAIGWLAGGVLISVLAGSETALLQGTRRIGDLARVNAAVAVIGAASGVALVYVLGEQGVSWAVATAPIAGLLVGRYYTAQLTMFTAGYRWDDMRRQFVPMLRLGLPTMAASLLTLSTQLSARSIIVAELGFDAAGYFQAAWAISTTYIGFVLGAMTVDYYPRLVQAVGDYAAVRRLVLEQTEMALLLAAPVLLVMVSLAPWLMHALYAPSFAEASGVLRWQIMGDVLKVVSWPMGYVLLATRQSKIFIALELTWSATYLAILFLCLPKWGVEAAGLGFLLAYLVYSVMLMLICRKLIHLRPDNRCIFMVAALFLCCISVVVVNAWSTEVALLIGASATILAAGYSLHRLQKLIDLSAFIKAKIAGPKATGE